MKMKSELLELLQSTGALKEGHFKLTSGRHSNRYVQCAQLMKSPRTCVELAECALQNVDKDVLKNVTCVVSPAVGGITWGFAVAYALGVDFIFAERKEGIMQLRRGFSLTPQDTILVAEDVVTTGGSVQEVIELAQAQGAQVAGVVSIIDRNSSPVFSEAFWPLITLQIESWEPNECELCAQGVSIEAPGSRNLEKK